MVVFDGRIDGSDISLSPDSPPEPECPFAHSFGIAGDRWTLLILRNALFGGDRRFDEFHRHLGIATNILARRLDALVADGILERTESSHPRSRHEYCATDKGEELWPVLAAYMQWGNRWGAEQVEPLHLVHLDCGAVVGATPTCPSCGRTIGPGNLRLDAARRSRRRVSR